MPRAKRGSASLRPSANPSAAPSPSSPSPTLPVVVPGRAEYVAIVAVGAAELAREVGMSVEAVSMRLRRGQTADQVRGAAKLRQLKINAGLPVPGKPAGFKHQPTPTPVDTRPATSPLPPPSVSTTAAEAPTTPRPPIQPVPVGLSGNLVSTNGDGVQENILQAQLRKEIALADQQRLKADEMAAKLVDRALVERWYANIVTKMTDMFTRIGPELADRLSIMSTPIECERAVSAKIREALSVMKEYQP